MQPIRNCLFGQAFNRHRPRVKCNIVRLVSLLVLSIVAAPYLSAHAGDEIVLLVKPAMLVTGTQVTLADIAENLASLPTGWAERRILASPVPGKAQSVTLMKMASALHQFPDMTDVILRGSSSVVIRRSGVPLDQALVREAINDYIAINTDWQATKIQIDLLEPPNHIVAESTNIIVQATGFEYNPRSLSHLFHLDIRDNVGPVQRIAVAVRVSAESQVWVAVHSIKQGSVLTDDDVKAQLVTTDMGGRKTFPASDPIAGFEAERPILAGETISMAMVRQPVCTDKGAPVDIQASRGSLAVSLRAIAMSKGRRGDQILCVNASSKRQLTAKLTAPGKAILVGM